MRTFSSLVRRRDWMQASGLDVNVGTGCKRRALQALKEFSEFIRVLGYVVPSEAMSKIPCVETLCRSGDDHNVSRL